MKKPTYEEKVQALKESIKHWEEVAEDPDNVRTDAEDCACCVLTGFNPERKFETGLHCENGCPIFEKTQKHGCKDTPYEHFENARTKENAQTEVIFLKNLLIEMLEKGEPRDYCKDCCHWVDDECSLGWECEHKKGEWKRIPKQKEEKKEEWVDVTMDVEWRMRCDGEDLYVLVMRDNGDVFGHMWADGEFYISNSSKYRACCGRQFRILKKVS